MGTVGERGSHAEGLMGAPTLDRKPLLQQTEWFDHALRGDLFTSWFQPIVDLSTSMVFAHECLIRLDGKESRAGSQIIQAAIARNQLPSFDAYARQVAIRDGSRQHEPGTYLFVNFFPSSIYDPECCFRSTLEALRRTTLRPSDVVFEAVEAEQMDDLTHLRRIREFFLREGLGFALDGVNVGPGAAKLMAELRPDFVKLHRYLAWQAADPARAAMIQALAQSARELHVAVIAKGIESAAAAELMQSFGVFLMQGWHFGHPAREMRANTAAALAKLMEQFDGQLEPLTAPG